MMGSWVSGLEFDRFPEADFGLGPVPPVDRLHETERGVCLTKVGIKFDRFSDQ